MKRYLSVLLFLCVAGRLIAQIPVIQVSHENYVKHIEASTDGKTVLTTDGITGKIWDGRYGQLMHTISAQYIAFTGEKKILSFEKEGDFQTRVNLIHPKDFSVIKYVVLDCPFENLYWCKDSSFVMVKADRSNFTQYKNYLLNVKNLEVKLEFKAYNARLDYDNNMLIVINYESKKMTYSCAYMDFDGKEKWRVPVSEKHISCCGDPAVFGEMKNMIFFKDSKRDEVYVLDKSTGKKTKSTYFDVFEKSKEYETFINCSRPAANTYFIDNGCCFMFIRENGAKDSVFTNLQHSGTPVSLQGWNIDRDGGSNPCGEYLYNQKLIGESLFALTHEEKGSNHLFSWNDIFKLWKFDFKNKETKWIASDISCFYVDEKNNRIYAGTAEGAFEVYDLEMSKKLLTTPAKKQELTINQAAVTASQMYLFARAKEKQEMYKLSITDLTFHKGDFSGYFPLILQKNKQTIFSSLSSYNNAFMVSGQRDSLFKGELLAVNSTHTKLLVRDGMECYVFNTANRSKTILKHAELPDKKCTAASFSPNDSLVFLRFSGGYGDSYYIADVYKGETQLVEKKTLYEKYSRLNMLYDRMQWAPDSKHFKLYWLEEVKTYKDIKSMGRLMCIYNVSGMEQSAYQERYPAWFPDGKYMLRLNPDKNVNEVLSADGKNVLAVKPFVNKNEKSKLKYDFFDSLIVKNNPFDKNTIIEVEGKKMIVEKTYDSLKFFDANNGLLLKQMTIPGITDMAIVNKGSHVMLMDDIFRSGILKIDTRNFNVFRGKTGEMPLFSSLDLLNEMPQEYNNSRGGMLSPSPEQVYTRLLHLFPFVDLNNTAGNKWMAITEDGVLKCYDLYSDSLLFSIFLSPDGYFVSNANNYYARSSKMRQLKFIKGETVFDLDQFDLKYNRPDMVLKTFGTASPETINAFYKAYLKRLKKMGFTEDMLADDFHLPEIEIKNLYDIPPTIDSAGIELDLNMNDPKYKLDRINLYINDVPVYGTNGIDLRKENIKSISKKVTLPLAEGQNKIQVSVLNQAGAESYKETVCITCQPKEVKKPNLYLVTIGDSKYKDSRFDLTYAAKDAEDIKSTFETNDSYAKVFTYTYTNSQVTKENVLKLKEELKKAKRDDVVLITVAGHGVLDKNLDYYLATYDMDFNDPSKKGLAYEELESLVDGIAPLKKIILLDACHSGEVDKEEVEQLAVNTVSSEGVKFRTAGVGIQKKQLGLKTTSELMSELFTDLRKGTGATVISSAGGVEYAMESDQWKNGLFTYCLLHGLKDKAADLNQDGKIMLSELQQYLRDEVIKLSNGAQQPTSRIENLSVDFRIW